MAMAQEVYQVEQFLAQFSDGFEYSQEDDKAADGGKVAEVIDNEAGAKDKKDAAPKPDAKAAEKTPSPLEVKKDL